MLQNSPTPKTIFPCSEISEKCFTESRLLKKNGPKKKERKKERKKEKEINDNN